MKNIRLFIVSITFAFGILIAHALNISLAFSLASTGFLLTLLALYRIFFKLAGYSLLPLLVNIMVYMLIAASGLLAYAVQQVTATNNHFASIPAKYLLIKPEQINKSANNLRFTARVLSVINNRQHTAGGNIIVSVRGNTVSTPISTSSVYIIPALYSKVAGPKNPFEFDYRRYLANNLIFHNIYLASSQILLVRKENENPILATIIHARNSAEAYFTKFLPQNIAAIVTALVTGTQNNIDADTRALFQNSGTVHVLSVSGMHVTMFIALVYFIAAPLRRLHYGPIILSVVVLLSLAAFCVFTGLSPSVVRAALMLAVYIILQLSGYKVSPLNVVGLAAFIQLAINPLLLFSVSFQLSYISVISIIIFYPLMARAFKPKYKAIRFICNIIFVSIAAQVLTLPLTVYYFHTVPLMSVPANLFINYPITLLMFLGYFAAVFHFTFLNTAIVLLCQFIISSIKFLTSFNYSFFNNVYITSYQAVCLTIVAICIISMVTLRSKSVRQVSLVCATVFLLFTTTLSPSPPQGAVFYSINKGYALLVPHTGSKATLFTNAAQGTLAYSVQPYINHYGIKYASLPHLATTGSNCRFSSHQLLLNNKLFLVVDSAFKNAAGIALDNYDYVWLRDNSYYIINNNLNPKNLIIDGTSSAWFLTTHTQYCAKHNINLINLKNGTSFAL